MTREKILAVALLLVLTAAFLTGCTSSGISSTCDRFGMDTKYVDVIAVEHDINGKGFKQTKFHCVPKVKLKNWR